MQMYFFNLFICIIFHRQIYIVYIYAGYIPGIMYNNIYSNIYF